MRFEVRVKPNSKGAWVGGTRGEGGALNVHVAETVVDGKADRAVVEILASALRVRRRPICTVERSFSERWAVEMVN